MAPNAILPCGQVLASDVQERLEAAARLLLAPQDAPGHRAQDFDLCLATASRIGREWRASQQALDMALKGATLTHGDMLHLAPRPAPTSCNESRCKAAL